MVTFEQALTANNFHENHAKGGKVYNWRRNGKTQTWKTWPGVFRIPVKYGLYVYYSIDNANAANFHVPADCPDSLDR